MRVVDKEDIPVMIAVVTNDTYSMCVFNKKD